MAVKRAVSTVAMTDAKKAVLMDNWLVDCKVALKVAMMVMNTVVTLVDSMAD